MIVHDCKQLTLKMIIKVVINRMYFICMNLKFRLFSLFYLIKVTLPLYTSLIPFAKDTRIMYTYTPNGEGWPL